MIVKSEPVGIAAYYKEYFAKARDLYWVADRTFRNSTNWRGT